MPTKTDRRNYILLVLVIFTSFVFFGISENIKGPAIPFMQAEFALSELEVGIMLAMNSLAYLLACSFTASLSRKIGLKATVCLGLIGMSAAGVGYLSCPNYLILIISSFVVFLGNGILEITLGVLCAKIFTKNTGTMMNLSHFFYGIASTLAPMAASYLITTTVIGWTLGWRGMYFIMLIGCVLPVIFAIRPRFPLVSSEDGEGRQMNLQEYLRDPVLVLIVLVLSCGVMAELSTGAWLVNYMQKARGMENSTAAMFLTLFFLMFSLSRLLLGGISEKVGYARWISIVTLFTATVIVAGLFIPGTTGAVLLSMAGLGVGTIYPTVMAILAKWYQFCIDSVMTITLTIMGIFSMVGNFAVGAITDGFCNVFGVVGGYRTGFLFIALCTLLCCIGAEALRKKLMKT